MQMPQMPICLACERGMLFLLCKRIHIVLPTAETHLLLLRWFRVQSRCQRPLLGARPCVQPAPCAGMPRCRLRQRSMTQRALQQTLQLSGYGTLLLPFSFPRLDLPSASSAVNNRRTYLRLCTKLHSFEILAAAGVTAAAAAAAGFAPAAAALGKAMCLLNPLQPPFMRRVRRKK
jgi:hypothetical protein